MKLPNPEEFTYKDCVIAGDDCWLITPQHIGCKWTDENARFRSCIVRKKDNKVLSQSLPKFKNWHEDPEFQPWDHSWPVDTYIKKDGSTILLSYQNPEFILRTRGVVSVFSQETGEEVYKLIESYPKIKDFVRDGKHTVVFEHTSPNRVIVLREDSVPTLTLLTIIWNASATMFTQAQVDEYAKDWNIPRPKKLYYNSVEECINDVKYWTHAEGVVLYSPDGNTLKKIKSDPYLASHALCTGMRSLDNVLDKFMVSPKFTKYSDFYNHIKDTLSFEVAEKIKDDILKIVVAYSKIVEEIHNIKIFIAQLEGKSRKDQALEIIQRWEGWKKTFSFLALDNRPIDDKILKSAIIHQLDSDKTYNCRNATS